jgi:hypothetical protein
MTSRQHAGRGRSRHLLCETVGALTFSNALVIDRDRLRLILRRWTIGPCPLPLWLAPRVEATESAEDGRYTFDIAIRHSLLGLLCHYRGWLSEPVVGSAKPPAGTPCG